MPGGDIRDADFAQFEADMRRRYAWLDSGILQRLLRSYGTRIEPMLGSASRPADLGRHFGHGLYEAEVDYLYRREFATAADDILWRRSKLGLKFEDRGRAALASWMGGDTATRQAGSSG